VVPSHFDDLPASIESLIDLVYSRQTEADGNVEDFEVLEEIAAAGDFLEGFVDGRAFEGWRDADDVLAAVLEVFVGEQYFWLPLEQVKKLRVQPAENLRDQLYRPITVWHINGEEFHGYMPTVYRNRDQFNNEELACGLGTDFVEEGPFARCNGQRLYLFGEEELTLDDFQQVEVRWRGES
jgi:protein involved in temperature-dependent protein secretion